MCRTSLSNKLLATHLNHVWIVWNQTIWSCLKTLVSLHWGWTPRLDGSLMIEHEIIETWQIDQKFPRGSQRFREHHRFFWSHCAENAVKIRLLKSSQVLKCCAEVKDSVVARMILGVRNSILQHMRQKVGGSEAWRRHVTDIHLITWRWPEKCRRFMAIWKLKKDAKFRLFRWGDRDFDSALGDSDRFSDLGEAIRTASHYQLSLCVGATSVSSVSVRPLKQRLSKSDLAKIGYGTPETAKALRNASRRVAEPCWTELLSCYELHVIETHLLRFEAIESVKNRKEKSEPKMNVPAWNHLKFRWDRFPERERERESLSQYSLVMTSEWSMCKLIDLSRCFRALVTMHN